MTTQSESNISMRFELECTDPWSAARVGSIQTARGTVATPTFMPVATQAALRGIDSAHAEALDFQILLANTYHLLLRPGPQIFERCGGIHKFMNWPRLVLTDSGGYQIFSLSRQLTMSEEGARFRSYVDGTEINLTPELSIEMQTAIGSDIMMVLDHCIDSRSDESTTRKALELTTRWAGRSLAARKNPSQALFGIIQGGCFPQLRRESASQIIDIPFDGYAIGGLAVGETRSRREDIVELTAALMPTGQPRYLMGVGTPIDLLEAVKRGIDMFDCILPTSLAHQGVCFTSHGKIDLRRGAYKNSPKTLDETCPCSTCQRFSRAYLQHLVRADEHVADQLLGLHNLTFYASLMTRIRESIRSGYFQKFYKNERDLLTRIDDEHPIVQPRVSKRKKSLTLGDYEIVRHKDGYASIRQISSGEIMHSVVNPIEEAYALYVDQSNVIEHLKKPGAPITVWDVGLGAATNAMACIIRVEQLENVAREVCIVSFEKDLDPLRLVLSQPALFKHIRHRAPHELLSKHQWKNQGKNLTWRLTLGDFRDTMQISPAPDVIWYDPFSFKVDSALWGVEVFRQLHELCSQKCTTLYTYSASTAIRAAMLAAGWYVGPGISTGPKSETTIAYNKVAAQNLESGKLLSNAWLERWTRSDAQLPFGEVDLQLSDLVRSHQQFSSSA